MAEAGFRVGSIKPHAEHIAAPPPPPVDAAKQKEATADGIITDIIGNNMKIDRSKALAELVKMPAEDLAILANQLKGTPSSTSDPNGFQNKIKHAFDALKTPEGVQHFEASIKEIDSEVKKVGRPGTKPPTNDPTNQRLEANGQDSEKTELTQQMKDKLNKFAKDYNEHGNNGKILLSGTADPSGTKDGNTRIAKQRADVAAKYLESIGIDPKVIEVDTHSSTGAKTDNPNDARGVRAYYGGDAIAAGQKEIADNPVQGSAGPAHGQSTSNGHGHRHGQRAQHGGLHSLKSHGANAGRHPDHSGKDPAGSMTTDELNEKSLNGEIKVIGERANGPGVPPDAKIVATSLDAPGTTTVAGRRDGKLGTDVKATPLPAPTKIASASPGSP